MTLGQQLVATKSQCAKIVVTLSQLCQLVAIGDVYIIYMSLSVPNTREVETLRVVVPDKLIHIALKSLAHETFLARLQIHDKQTVLVALIAIMLHTLPSDVLTVRRVLWIGVVTHDFRTDISGLLGSEVIDKDVRVGRDSILQSRFLATGIGNLLAVRTPRQLLHTSERLHRTLVRFALQNICNVLKTVVEVSHKGVGSSSHPFIPMLVHQVSNDATRGFRKVRIFVCCAGHRLYLTHKQHLALIW